MLLCRLLNIQLSACSAHASHVLSTSVLTNHASTHHVAFGPTYSSTSSVHLERLPNLIRCCEREIVAIHNDTRVLEW